MAFICPDCRARAVILESCPAPNGRRRRYRCEQGHRFTTLEHVAKRPTGAGATKARPLRPDAVAQAKSELLDKMRRALEELEASA